MINLIFLTLKTIIKVGRLKQLMKKQKLNKY